MQRLVWQNSNGDEINLTSGNYGITNWEGFANTSLNIQSQQVPFQDGGVFLDALMEQRELSVTLAMYDGGNLETRYRMRRELVHALNPKLGEGYLIYTNDFISKRIKCVAQIPLFETHNSNNSGTPKASLSWTACDPYWEDLEETTVTFNINEHKLINNNGDVPCQMKIEFLTANVTNPQILRNDDKFIKYNGILTNNLLINTENGQKSVKSEIEKKYFIGTGQSNFNIVGMCYSENLKLLLITSDSGMIFTTKDGINYNTIYIDCDCKGCCVGKNGDLWIVGIGITTDSTYVYKSNDGENFEIINTFSSRNVNDIAYSPTLDMLLICAGTDNYYSYNYGDTWETTESGYFRKLIWIGDKFLSSNGSYSNDGINWSNGTFDVQINGYNVILAKGIYLIVGSDVQGHLCISKSVDCENWSLVYQDEVNMPLFNICYSPLYEKFYIAKYGNSVDNPIVIAESVDGENWTNVKTTDIVGYCNVFYYWQEKGLFLFGVDNIYSGITINELAPVFENDFSDSVNTVCYSERHKIFVCGGYQNISISKDGKKWQKVYSTYRNVNKIIYSEEKDIFIAVGGYGTIYSSNDGINWYERNITENNIVLTSIAYGNGLFIAVGENAYIYKSYNGINWQTETIEQGISLFDVVNVDDNFYAVGYTSDNDGYLLKRDMNGIWTSFTVSQNKFQKIIYDGTENKLYLWGYNVPSGRYNIYYTDIDNIDIIFMCNTNEGNNLIYIKPLGCFIITTEEGISISNDIFNWSFIPIGSTYFEYKDGIYVNDSLLIVGEAVFIIMFTTQSNLIQNITADSDMGLNIELGENIFRLIMTQGNFTCRIKYRQKYIGV